VPGESDGPQQHSLRLREELLRLQRVQALAPSQAHCAEAVAVRALDEHIRLRARALNTEIPALPNIGRLTALRRAHDGVRRWEDLGPSAPLDGVQDVRGHAHHERYALGAKLLLRKLRNAPLREQQIRLRLQVQRDLVDFQVDEVALGLPQTVQAGHPVLLVEGQWLPKERDAAVLDLASHLPVGHIPGEDDTVDALGVAHMASGHAFHLHIAQDVHRVDATLRKMHGNLLRQLTNALDVAWLLEAALGFHAPPLDEGDEGAERDVRVPAPVLLVGHRSLLWLRANVP